MLLVGRIARGGLKPGAYTGYGGEEFDERVLRWERRGNRVLLRAPAEVITADSTQPIFQSVVHSAYPPIVATFPVEAYGADSAPVIDVTRLYRTRVPEFVAIAGAVDSARSLIEQVRAFPDNIEVEATQTGADTSWKAPGVVPNQAPPAATVSVLAHWSMIRLPEHPMRPRLLDTRIGYYGTQQVDFGRQLLQRAGTEDDAGGAGDVGEGAHAQRACGSGARTKSYSTR